MAVARIGALASAAYFALVVGLTVAGRVSGSAALADLARRVTLPSGRRLVATLVGIGLATTVTASATVADSRTTSGAPVTADVLHRVAPETGPLPVLHRLPDVPDPPPSSRTWTIAPGDHLWHVAEATLGAVGPQPTDAETARYLAALVEQNRSILLDPGDPDLVRPGQVFSLPPVG